MLPTKEEKIPWPVPEGFGKSKVRRDDVGISKDTKAIIWTLVSIFVILPAVAAIIWLIAIAH